MFLLWIIPPKIGIRFVPTPIYALQSDGEQEGVAGILLNTDRHIFIFRHQLTRSNCGTLGSLAQSSRRTTPHGQSDHENCTA